MGFAENLKKYRTAKGISQDELAKRIGSHAVQFSRYERGLSAPSIEVVQKISEVLDVSIDELVFGDKDQKIEQTIKDRELISLFQKVELLSDKQRETVKELLNAFIFQKDLQQKLAQ
ncbi:MAG: helix-turn-helix transcriptional regulator [Bacteroidota bacterium]